MDKIDKCKPGETQPVSNASRKNHITLLSVVSCIAVVLLHTNGCFWNYSTETYWKTANVIECLAYFAVPCFFMISGATLMDYRERYSLKEYFSKRIAKTVVPFLAWSIIGVIYALCTGTVKPGDLSLGGLYNGIMGATFVSVYWFFPSLFCLYLSIPAFAAVEKAARKEIFSYLAIAGFLVNFAVPLIKDVRFPNAAWPLSVGPASGVLIYALIGCLLEEYELSARQRHWIYAGAFAGFLIHLIGTYIVSTEAGTVLRTYKGYASAPCIMYSTGIYVWFRAHGEKLMENQTIKKAAAFLSPYTFGIYLVHWFLLDILQRITDIDATSMVYRLGAPLLVIPGAVGILWVLKKIPVLRKIVP